MKLIGSLLGVLVSSRLIAVVLVLVGPVKPFKNLTQGGIVLPYKNLTQADSI